MVGSHNSPSPKAIRPYNFNTAGNGNITAFISIPYCAKHNLPSPTDFRFPVPGFRFPFSDSRFTVSDGFPIPDSRFTVFVRFIANRFRVIAYPWTRIFASILPENQPPYGVLVDF